MTMAQRIKATASRAAASAGGGAQVVIRRSGPGLKSAATGAVLTTLLVDGTVAIGESSLDLNAVSIAPGGILGNGWEFTLSGHTAPYVVQADAESITDAVESVSFLPVLSHEATHGATVAISQQYGEWTYNCFREVFERGQVDGEIIETEDYKLVVSLLGASFSDINEAGDIDRATFDGEAVNVVSVLPIEPGTDPAVLRLHCRG